MSSAIPRPTDPQRPTQRRAAFWRMFLGRPRTRHHHLDALDGLRGLAVLIVLASHLSNMGLHLLPGLSFSGTGKSGVYLFFVLSAFLLTRALLQRPPAGFANARLWANYALRRVLRIWPLYLVVLLLSWGLTMAGVVGWHYSLDTSALLRHLALREGQSVLWSIPVEFTFYLWLPLLALGLAWTRHRHWPFAAEAALALAAVALATWAWPPSQTGVNDVRLGPYLVLFLCGVFAARLDYRLRAMPRPPSRRFWGLVGVLVLLGCVVTVPEVWARFTGAPFNAALNHQWFLFFGLMWSCLLLAVLHGPDGLRAPFAWAPARLLGVVSFSAYLWHMPVLDAVRAAGVGASWFAPLLVVAAVLFVAMLSFLAFERPWRDIRLRQASRTDADASEAGACATVGRSQGQA